MMLSIGTGRLQGRPAIVSQQPSVVFDFCQAIPTPSNS